ncbi:MAG: carboxypeptidase regulatory-like domain-containing protein, partial [Bryobacteraceae bacterium]
MFLRILTLLVALSTVAAHAQVAGTISGYVKDQTGAIVANANIQAVLTGQQLTRSAVTDPTGFYNMLAMPPGGYEFSVTAAGFQKQVQSDVRLTSGENLRLDAELKVGSVQSEVTVSSQATLVNTTSQTLSGLVDDRRVTDLPLSGRNVISLARILPGITEVNAPQEPGDTRAGPNMSVNGGRSVNNNFTFNGANFTHFGQTTGMNVPPPDAVQEIRIQTHNFTSEYGNNSGSQVTVTSKAGTNQFHGSAWEFLRNDKLNSRSFFQPRRPQTRQNQFGASAGGPVKRDKLFVFGYYQRLENRPETGSSQTILPSAAERSGDFRHLTAQIRNPTHPLTGQPMLNSAGSPCVAGNVISPSCISPASRGILERFIPITPNNLIVTLNPQSSNAESYMARVDFLQTRKHNLFGHLYHDSYNRRSTSGYVER